MTTIGMVNVILASVSLAEPNTGESIREGRRNDPTYEAQANDGNPVPYLRVTISDVLWRAI